MTIVCPFDCEYLREARLHERQPDLDEPGIPDADIRLTERFLAENAELLSAVAQALFDSTRQNPDVNDNDVREALDSLIRTYRTLQSGLYYESRPANPMAEFAYEQIRQMVAALHERLRQSGRDGIRDASVLGVLVFFRRTEGRKNNGRLKSRAFLDFLRQHVAMQAEREISPNSPLIVP